MTDGMTVTSLPASLRQKISMTKDSLCKISSNQKLSHKLEKRCKFASHVKAKLRKKKQHKMRHPCIWETITHQETCKNF